MRRTESLSHAREAIGGRPTAVTFGVFDGLHRAHQALIRETTSRAQARDALSAVLTFAEHPLALLAPAYVPPRLLTPARKAALIEEMGVDLLITVAFDEAFAAQSPESFVTDVLRGALGAEVVVMGYNNRFGARGAGDAALMRDLGAAHGFEAVALEPLMWKGAPVSSTRVRQLLEAGKVRRAAEMLTRPHRLPGEVIAGDGRGRAIGFPTANLRPTVDHLVPAGGVYAVRARAAGAWHDGMMNIGTRPTFGGVDVRVEVHLFDFEGDLYGQTLEVDFIERLRREERFGSAEALVAQLNMDADTARRILRER